MTKKLDKMHINLDNFVHRKVEEVESGFKKLLFIIEILLENECGLLTSNFLITDSYIGKRTFLLRASHTAKEMEEKIANSNFLSGISKTRREFLEKYIKTTGNKT